MAFVKPPQPFGFPVEIGPIHDPAMIHRPQHFDRLFGDLDLPVVSLRHLTSMHHHRESTDGVDFVVLDLEIDRHRFLQQRIGPPAGTKGTVTAQHQNAATEMFAVIYQHPNLCIGEGFHIALSRIIASGFGDVC